MEFELATHEIGIFAEFSVFNPVMYPIFHLVQYLMTANCGVWVLYLA